MISIGINLLGQAAKTALFGAITNKVVDTVISSQLNKKDEHKKWRRETKLQFFSKLSQEVLSFDLENSNANDERSIKEICAKTVLVLDDKKLIYKIEEYINTLNNTQRTLIFNQNDRNIINRFNEAGMNLVVELNENLKRS